MMFHTHCRLVVLGAIFLLSALGAAEPSHALLQAKSLSDGIALRLQTCTTCAEKVQLLVDEGGQAATIERYPLVQSFLAQATPEEQYVIDLMVALHQADALFDGMEKLPNAPEALRSLVSTLVALETFYQPIGGLLGYNNTVIDLMTKSDQHKETSQYVPPPYTDLRVMGPALWAASYEGVSHLGSTAFIFAMGGAGDRLNLIDTATGEPLPAACLSFCGRSLFAGLMRDVEALEYWQYRAFGRRTAIPILIMTSQEKNNDRHIEQMGNASNWFGHRHDAIRRMIQPLVPVIDIDGQWLVSSPLELALKPGGHGVIWKLAKDSGALEWLQKRGIDDAVVRQINNPLAGLDQNLAILAGYGRSNHKSFGFLSCPSCSGLAEGMNILDVRGEGATTVGAISNIEYTKFGALKASHPDLFKEGSCPANTNILYIDLHAIDRSLAKNPIPGMIVNAKTNVDVVKNGQTVKKVGGRLESCMQNIADGLASPLDREMLPRVPADALETFLLLQGRNKVMSTAKSALQPGRSPLETPSSCLYDWNKAMRQLMTQCHVIVPHEQTLEEFLRDGPSVLISIHPAMGPFWDVIGQKISDGIFAEGSEVELEIAELSCKELAVDGSFRLCADIVTGPIHGSEGRLFTNAVGRAKLHKVTILNEGLNKKDVDSVLQGTVGRKEVCEIVLKGFSELVAENVMIQGDFHLTVPDGQRAILTQGPEGAVVTTFEPMTAPSWIYTIDWKRGSAPVLKEARASAKEMQAA
jgi:hypothetical protein